MDLPPAIRVEVVSKFVYHCSIVTNKFLSSEDKVYQQNTKYHEQGKQTSREHSKLTVETKVKIYHACIFNAFERQQILDHIPYKHLNSFHLQCLGHILEISWRDKVSYSEVLECVNISSIHCLLNQH